MEQSSKFENTCDIFVNERRMEDEQELKENVSVQITRNRNLEKIEEKVKENLKRLHAQRLFWKPNNRNALCRVFYYVNDN
jgi:hypothetical protein